MPRESELFTAPHPDLQDTSTDLQALSVKPHALNVLVSEFDFQRLKMLGEIQDDTVSGIIRHIVDKAFEDLETKSPDTYTAVVDLAVGEMENAVARNNRRAQYLQAKQSD